MKTLIVLLLFMVSCNTSNDLERAHQDLKQVNERLSRIQCMLEIIREDKEIRAHKVCIWLKRDYPCPVTKQEALDYINHRCKVAIKSRR